MKQKKIIPVIILLSFLFGCDSNKIEKKDKVIINNCDLIFSNFEERITNLRTESNDSIKIFELAKLYSLMNSSDSAFYYIKKSLVSDSTTRILCEPAFYNIFNLKEWSEIEKLQIMKIEKKRKRNYKYPEIVKEFWKMLIIDQCYYLEMDYYDKKCGVNNPKSDSLWIIKNKLNIANLEKLERIIQKYNWPKISEFGNSACDVAFLIVQHSDLSTQKKYLPIIEEMCKINEAKWSNYALMKDRILTSDNQLQIYGTQVKYNDIEKRYELFPLMAPERVDNRRVSVGLDSLKIYLRNWDIEFNIKQN